MTSRIGTTSEEWRSAVLPSGSRTFSEPVCSCSFTIYDIDGSNTTFTDSQGAPVISGDTALTNDFRDAIAILDAIELRAHIEMAKIERDAGTAER